MILLHVSDLHCAGNNGVNQLLRPGFYDEYIRLLCEKIRQRQNSPDVLIVTGDLSHKCEVSGFSLARGIIEEFRKHFAEITPDRILMCVGNHDYRRELQRKGEFEQARAEFGSEVAQHFGPADRVQLSAACWAARLVLAGESMSVLSIDSTWGNRNCLPGWIWSNDTEERATTDAVVRWVKTIPPTETLIVLSHFPIHLDDSLADIEGEVDFRRLHLAGRLENLRRRIRENRRPMIGSETEYAPTIWLYGDVHKPMIRCEAPHYHMVVGRLDTPLEVGGGAASRTDIAREARTVRIAHTSNQPNVTATTYRWTSLTHRSAFDHPEVLDLGEWIAIDENLREGEKPVDGAGDVAVTRSEGAIISSPKGSVSSEVVAARTFDSIRNSPKSLVVDEFDATLSEAIVDFVARNGLLRLQRHPCCDGWERLTHIELGPVFNDMVIAGQALWCFGDFVRNNVGAGVNPENALILGVDVWGSAVACDLSVRTGIPNLGITLRGSTSEAALTALKDDTEVMGLRGKKNLILVTDVVVTGDTLCRAYDVFVGCRGSDVELTAWALALICPAAVRFRRSMSFLTRVGAACSKLPFMLAQLDELPTPSVLRPVRASQGN
jgi:hypothetical protein